jgi:hypothetical protein
VFGVRFSVLGPSHLKSEISNLKSEISDLKSPRSLLISKEPLMSKSLAILPALLLSSIALADQSKPDATVAEKKPWTIEATPDTTTVQPGGKLEIKVRIVNSTDAKSTVYIRNLLWYARSDSPQMIFAQWPKMAGRGPVITYKAVELGPKEAYSHSWSCTVAGDAPAGELTFRIGVPLKADQGKPEEVFWSAPVKLKVKGP